jgi:hypothetical protein
MLIHINTWTNDEYWFCVDKNLVIMVRIESKLSFQESILWSLYFLTMSKSSAIFTATQSTHNMIPYQVSYFLGPYSSIIIERVDFVLTRMSVGVFVTLHLFLEIHAHHGIWRDSFLFPLFIWISKQNGWLPTLIFHVHSPGLHVEFH